MRPYFTLAISLNEPFSGAHFGSRVSCFMLSMLGGEIKSKTMAIAGR